MDFLNRDQIDFYEANGYLTIEEAVTPLQLAMLRGITYSVIDRSRPLTVSDEVFDLDTGHSPENPKLKHINALHLQDRIYMDVLRDSSLKDVLIDILGPNVALLACTLNPQSPGRDKESGWHQDWALAPHTNDNMLTLGLLLEDMDEESGPLTVVPGSHRGPIMAHTENGVFCGRINERDHPVNRDQTVALTGKAGTLTIHHCRTIHSVDRNKAEHCRLILFYECASADSWPVARIAGHGTRSAAKSRRQQQAGSSGCMITGQPCATPRMAHLPVRLPKPPDHVADTESHDAGDPDCSCAA